MTRSQIKRSLRAIYDYFVQLDPNTFSPLWFDSVGSKDPELMNEYNSLLRLYYGETSSARS